MHARLPDVNTCALSVCTYGIVPVLVGAAKEAVIFRDRGHEVERVEHPFRVRREQADVNHIGADQLKAQQGEATAQ